MTGEEKPLGQCGAVMADTLRKLMTKRLHRSLQRQE
jgi:hypothetical protein